MKPVFSTLIVVVILIAAPAWSQTFTRVTDASNPIASDAGPGGYSGASWVDVDNDGDLDLFVNNNKLYRNDGGGAFTSLVTTLGTDQPISASIIGNGNSWADYDNDGDLDCFIASATSFLYRNDGGGVFTKITAGVIGDGASNPGWACAWADYNNDGYVDLAITHPANFVPVTPTPNHLLLNNGPPDFTFTKVTSGPIVTGLAAYTVGSWSDFDQDGDMDYFIGAGPAVGTTTPDYLYRNMLAETDTPYFERITTGVIATDAQDGQIWNWVDYDNDGDFDAYLTNYWGGLPSGMPNRLYRNDGGTFTRISTGSIVTDAGFSLSSVWADYDNDGDQDCYVGNDSNQPGRYYRNNGNGTFTTLTTPMSSALTHRGASAGDYDNDGDLDLVVMSPGVPQSLYRNDTPAGNHWLKIRCVGTVSNRAAIGTRVRVKATIGGIATWQLREVSSQNTFNGHNSLELHVGLGDAIVADSIVFEWPLGMKEVLTNISTDQFLSITEGNAFNVNTPVVAGWNIVSVGVELENALAAVLFPEAASVPFRFQPGVGYVPSDSLSVGTAYWIKFPSTATFSHIGRQIHADTIGVDALWNLLGTISLPVSTESVTPVGTSIDSPFFEFGPSGYVQTTELLPGRGYWVKVSTAGQLIIANPPTPPAVDKPGRADQ